MGHRAGKPEAEFPLEHRRSLKISHGVTFSGACAGVIEIMTGGSWLRSQWLPAGPRGLQFCSGHARRGGRCHVASHCAEPVRAGGCVEVTLTQLLAAAVVTHV